MLFAQRQNSPHELGQNPVANGIGEHPHWVHESLVFTKPCWSVFFASQKRVVLSFPAETICQTDMAVKASTFHFAARLDLIHQWRTHPSLLPALPGTFGCQVSMFHAHQGASGLGNTMKAANDVCQLSNTINNENIYIIILTYESVLNTFHNPSAPFTPVRFHIL